MSPRPEPAIDPKELLALRAAQLYYIQDHTMEAIAAELGTSRSSVSRLLSLARDLGIVDIQVRSPLESGARLERELRARYRVSAHVVPAPDRLNDVDRLERVALTAARLLPRFVDANQIVGIAWGSTVSAISRHLPQKETHNTVIVQLNGAGNTETTGVEYASEILGRFGSAFHARTQQFPVPAIFDDPATREALWRERSMRRVLDLHDRLDVAVFGLGSSLAAVPSRVHIGGYLDAADYRSLEDDRVVGDVATVFYRADGTWEDVALNARTSGPGIDRIRRAARRVCVVSGAQKLETLRGALAAGIVTDLVLDEGLARRLVQDPA